MTAVVERGEERTQLVKEKMKAGEPDVVEIIDERRTDSSGRVMVNQFIKGKMLGKVRKGYVRTTVTHIMKLFT